MARVADMAAPLLREIADGRTRSVGEIEEILARSMGLARADLNARTKNSLAADARHKIGRVKSSLKRAGLVSYPRRGSIKITRKGLAEISGDSGRSELQSGMLRRASSERTSRPVARGLGRVSTVYSPPLSPAELADIEAIASGAVKLRRVSKSEFIRMITDAAKPKADVENHVR